MSDGADYDVVINGGGPVGMGLAIELGQRGVRTCVVERHADPQPIPKGQNLTQRTCEHFAAWSCEDALRAAHPLPKGAGIGGLTAYGTLLSGYSYDWLNRAHVKDYYFSANARLPQYATERVLRQRVATLASVDVLVGWSGTNARQDAENAQLVVERQENGESGEITARYVVGCDGSRSVVRERAGLSETVNPHNRLMALVVFRSEALHALLERFPGKAFYNVLHPRYEGYWQFFGRVDHGLSWFFHAPVPYGTTRESLDVDTLLSQAVGERFDFEVDHVGLWDLRVSLANRYRTGRIFVAGDAAHSHPPYGGFGINLGFEDARNLGWKLAAVLQGWGGAKLLDSYDAERRPVFASTARDFIERFIEEDRAFLETHYPERDEAAFAEAWASRNLDAAEVHAFAPHYAGSPVVCGDGGGPSARGRHEIAARSGQLLPPPSPDARSAVLTGLGEGPTLLSSVPDVRARFARAAAERSIPLTLCDLAPAWEAAYETQSILLRPDRFVSWTDHDGGRPQDALLRSTGHEIAA